MLCSHRSCFLIIMLFVQHERLPYLYAICSICFNEFASQLLLNVFTDLVIVGGNGQISAQHVVSVLESELCLFSITPKHGVSF